MTVSCKLFPSSHGDSADVDPFPITCYQHNLSGTRISTYSSIVFLCWCLLNRSRCFVSRRVVSICRKLRQCQLYNDPPAPSLAFRQRSGIAVRIEAVGFRGTRVDWYGEGFSLIFEETLTTSPDKRPCPPPAWSINRPDIEQCIRDRLRCSRLFKRVDGRHFRTCPWKGKRTIIAETRARRTREQSSDAIGAIALRRRCDDYYVSM